VPLFQETFNESRADKAPLSAHPAFPAIVALWFAALLGLGSLVLPIALIERLATLTGIALIVPAAKAPLGITARAIIALAAASAGAGIGLLLARKAVDSSSAERLALRAQDFIERECRPISAHDELGEEGFDSPDSPLFRKRRKPWAAEAWQDSPIEELDLVAQAVAEDDYEPLELDAFASPEDLAMQDEPMTDLRSHHPAAFGEQGEEAGEPQSVAPAFAPEPAETEALPFAAPSLKGHGKASFDEGQAAQGVASTNSIPLEYRDTSAAPAPHLTVVETGSGASLDERPLDELGLVQLATRLGASIERRRAWLAQQTRSGSAVPTPITPSRDPDHFDAAEADEIARATAEFFAPGTVTDTGYHAETEAPAFDVPIEASGDDEDLDETELGDEGYSSLLAMKNPFARQQELPRIERADDATSAIAPKAAEKPTESAQSPASEVTPLDPGDPERSLRDALATLQRMSGAA